MAADVPSLAQLAAEEEELQLSSFTDDDAGALGCALVDAARRAAAPVAIEITRNSPRLFPAALTGPTRDNASWIECTSRAVHRFGHSSLHVRQAGIERGTTSEEKDGLDPALRDHLAR